MKFRALVHMYTSHRRYLKVLQAGLLSIPPEPGLSRQGPWGGRDGEEAFGLDRLGFDPRLSLSSPWGVQGLNERLRGGCGPAQGSQQGPVTGHD